MIAALIPPVCGGGCDRVQPNHDAGPSASAPLPPVRPSASAGAEARSLVRYPSEFRLVSLRGSAIDPFVNGNSIEGATAAFGDGVRFVEMDFRLASDGVLVSYHDQEIYGCGMVATLDHLSAKACTLPGGRHVATLDEVLKLGFEGVYVDLKDTKDAARTARVVNAAADAIERAGTRTDVVVMLYGVSPEALTVVRRRHLRAGIKGYPASVRDTERMVREASENGFEMVCVNSEFVTPELVAQSAELGVWHLPWSIRPDQVEHWQRLARAGVGGMVVLHYRLLKDKVAPQWKSLCPLPAGTETVERR